MSDENIENEIFSRLRSSAQIIDSLTPESVIQGNLPEEQFIDLMEKLQDIQVSAFALRKIWWQKFTDKFPENAWGWYYLSSFLWYEANDKQRAFAAANKSIEILKTQNHFIGAIIRNYIIQSFELGNIEAFEAEIKRHAFGSNNKPDVCSGIYDSFKDDIKFTHVSKEVIQFLKENKD